MTKNEFVQRVAIALAGNPKFADDDRLSVISICGEADRLADTFEERSNYGLFENEDETDLHCISTDLNIICDTIGGYVDDGSNNIKESLSDISKYLNNPDNKPGDLSAPQELAKSLWDIEGHMRNIVEKMGDIEE